MTTFLLSPANLAGKRAGYLRTGAFDLAVRYRGPGAPLGEVFSFVSGLYFRGKLAYARVFGVPLVITAGRGLVHADETVGPADLSAFAAVPIDEDEPRYTASLQRDAARLEGPVVLLGSLATAKYVAPLSAVLGERLLYPPEFLGQGDMRRGSILLKAARARAELAYRPWGS
jgi:hypothetical protein